MKTLWKRLVLGILLFSAVHAFSADVDGDISLKSSVITILEQELLWEPESYHVEVDNGVVTLTLVKDSLERRQRAEYALSHIDGLKVVNITVTVIDVERDGKRESIGFPQGDIFRPLLANPKEPQFFVAFAHLESKDDSTQFTAGLVGLGTSFGLKRWPTNGIDQGWQVDFFAIAFSQFNMNTDSKDLINTDYLVGIPLSYKKDNISMRLRLYHQSSHLGDEFILSGVAPDRINLSIEVIDLLLAREWGGLRMYAGGGYAIGVEPDDLERGIRQLGIDYHSRNGIIAGIDVNWLEEVDWEPGVSAVLGTEFGEHGATRHGISLRLFAYDGPAPFGQFFTEDIVYYGAGIYFDF